MPMVGARTSLLQAHIVVLDEHGNVVAVNTAWRRFAESEDGRSDYSASNYIAVCEAARTRSRPPSSQV